MEVLQRCVLYALVGARMVVVGGSSWRYLLVIGQLLLQLLGLLSHGGQEVGGRLAGRRRLLHVVVETLPHSGWEGDTHTPIRMLIFFFLMQIEKMVDDLSCKQAL